ncbi:MAG: synthase gamma chain [Actinomycetota bacterium]|jgi:F-type H+-transporting ATPase subunit gamma
MGAQLRIYRQKIKSAQTTKKITRAMELISASRIQKAQTRMNSAAPYTKALTRAVTAVAVGSNVDHPLTTQTETPRRAAVVVFTSDRGLAGAFSSQVLREVGELAEKLSNEGKEVVYYLVGRKSVSYFSFRQRKWERDWIGGTDRPEVETAQEISEAVIAHFLKSYDEGGVDEIHLVYNRFVNLVSQVPSVLRLLPLEVVEADADEPIPTGSEILPLYEFEPHGFEVLDKLLPVFIENRIFAAMLSSAAAEHAARQKAMKSATDNADKLIQNYTRLANNARQSEITQQISEIVGGADALVSAK